MLFGYVLIAYWIDLVVRTFIMFFEVGLLRIDDETILDHSSKLPWNFTDKMFILLFICSVFRVYFMALITSVSLMLAVERYFATIWSSTYEIKKYKFISIFLVSSNISVGLICSFVCHYELLLKMSVLAFLAICLNFLSIILFVALYKLNKLKMEFCQTREVTSSYTLSLRFQLNENMKVMSWMKNLIFVVTFFNAVLAGFLIISNEKSIGDDYPALQLFCHAIVNLGIAVYAEVTIFVVLFSDKNFRKYFLRFGTIRILTKPFCGRIFPEDFKVQKTLSTSEETNVYFSKLSSQWDDQMEKRAKNGKPLKNKKNIT